MEKKVIISGFGGIKFNFFTVFLTSWVGKALFLVVFVFGWCFWGLFGFYRHKNG